MLAGESLEGYGYLQASILSSIENLVPPPGRRPYGPTAGPGQSSMALPLAIAPE
jgi:hypothetical protein